MFGYITEPLLKLIISTYCPYKSFKAIQSDNPGDDAQWLTFWVVYSLVSIAEGLTEMTISGLVPFYYELVFALYIWMIFFNGAGQIFKIVEPMLGHVESLAAEQLDAQLDKMGDLKAKYSDFSASQGEPSKHTEQMSRGMLNDLMANGPAYVQQYGEDAYNKLVGKAAKQAAVEATSPKKDK
ncbi:unnamed protein product [Heterosigma akashiwo]